MSVNNENLTGHDYDGIQEFDNPLPIWWMITFFATIIFSFIYWIHYDIAAVGLTQTAELKMDLAALPQANQQGGRDSEDELKNYATVATNIEMGKSVYQSKCAACHGENLQGVIGPNLVDEYWIHGKGNLVDIAKTVRQGVADKGMPPWETMLKEDEIKSVIVFVASQKGTTVANPKAPQGERIVSQ